METHTKKHESSTMNHGEEEEMQHDISKLQDQVQQISLSQKVIGSKMDGLKKGMEAKMNGTEANIVGIESKMYSLEVSIEYFNKDMEGLAKLLQEMFLNREKVVEDTHDENKINVNRDSIEYNVGFKTHHVPKINMMKFDGKDPVTSIL